MEIEDKINGMLGIKLEINLIKSISIKVFINALDIKYTYNIKYTYKDINL